jgi:hypothetical protein
LLEKKEDILYEEHDKCINAEKSLALEIKKNETLASELSSCHDSNSSCWGLVLKCYELITRQHKMLKIKALRPSMGYFPEDITIFG